MTWTGGTLSGSGTLSTAASSTTLAIFWSASKFISGGYTLRNFRRCHLDRQWRNILAGSPAVGSTLEIMAR